MCYKYSTQDYIDFKFEMAVCAKMLANFHDELIKIIVEK